MDYRSTSDLQVFVLRGKHEHRLQNFTQELSWTLFFFFFAFNLIKYHISYPDCLQQLLGVTGMGNDMRVQ